MKVFKIDVCDIDKTAGESFTGSISVNMPNYKERLSIVGDMKLGDEKTDSAIKILDIVEKHVTGIDLKTVGGVAITTFEELGYIAEGVDLINHLGSVFIKGIPLSGKPEPRSV